MLTLCVWVFLGFLAGPSLQAPLILRAASKTVKSGEEVCVEVAAQQFVNIISMQYSMKWDRKVLKFKEVRDFRLPGLSTANFGQHQTAKGVLTFSWYDQNLRGITLRDGTILYQVCFEAIGAPGSKAYFRFVEFPTPVEIANARSQFLQLEAHEGIIKVQ